MSHDVETMAYTNELPWHGLGFKVDNKQTVPGMLKAAKLDWKVEKKPLAYFDGDDHHAFKGHYALVRDSDQSVLDVVGNQYTPIQNEEAFEFFKEFVEAGDAHMETAGSLRGGRMTWGLAKLGAGFKLKGDDQVDGYLLVAAPHEAGKSFVCKLTTVRVVCNNTLTLALRGEKDENGKVKKGNEFRMAHRTSMSAEIMEKAKSILGIAREQTMEFKKNAEILQKIKMDRWEVVNVLAPVFQPGLKLASAKDMADFGDLAAPKMKILMDALERAPGAQPDNGWGVLNACSYFSSHVASRTNDKRLTNAWFGKTGNQVEKVLKSLLDLA